MKNLITGLKIVSVIALIFNLLVWLAAQASSHNIPENTNDVLGIGVFVSFFLLLLAIYWGRKIRKQ